LDCLSNVSSLLHVPTHLIVTTAMWDWSHYFSLLIAEETEAWTISHLPKMVERARSRAMRQAEAGWWQRPHT
jgi:hypothetical protein